MKRVSRQKPSSKASQISKPLNPKGPVSQGNINAPQETHESTEGAGENGQGDSTFYLRLIQSLLLTAINGVPHLRFRSARELARQFKSSKKYRTDADRIHALIAREASKNFSTGFLAGIGGLITLPFTIPAGMSASWVIQTRLAAAIADIHGHDLDEEGVQTLTLLCIVGDAGKEGLKRAGISSGVAFTEQALGKLSGEVLLQVNRQIGINLLASAGGTGLIKLGSLVPVAGGVVGGTIDAVACSLAGATANKYFLRNKPGSE